MEFCHEQTYRHENSFITELLKNGKNSFITELLKNGHHELRIMHMMETAMIMLSV